MAQIELKLSARVQKETGMREVMIRFVQGWKFNARAKSGIFVSPDYFEYFIDRTKTEKAGVKVPNSLITITEDRAEQKHFFLRESGLVVIKQRLDTPDVKYHREQANRLDELKRVIIAAYESNRDTEITSEWSIMKDVPLMERCLTVRISVENLLSFVLIRSLRDGQKL